MLDLSITTEEQKQRAKLLENREWFDMNLEKIKSEYAGKVIAIYDSKIVASGNSADEINNVIGGKYPEIEVLKILVPSEPLLVVPYPE
jgi:hypothetical protein